jgi:hypothetical protein
MKCQVGFEQQGISGLNLRLILITFQTFLRNSFLEKALKSDLLLELSTVGTILK